MPITAKNPTHLCRAIVLATLGALFLSLMAMCAKLASTHTTEPVITFFRFAITGFYIFAALLSKKVRGQSITLKTNHFTMHMIRALSSTGAMYSLYYALHHIPLVDANLLTLTYPLFALVLMAIFYRKKAGLISWLGILIGFLGIIFVLKPTSELLNPASIVGLFSGILAAVSILGIHELSKEDHPYTIMFYYTVVAFVISSILVIFYWQTPDQKTWLELAGVGIFGMLYQELLTRSLAYTSAHITSSLMYLSVAFSSIFGILIWGYIPDIWSWIGIVLICLGNIFVISNKQ